MEKRKLLIYPETIKKFIAKNCVKVLGKEEDYFEVEFWSPFKSVKTEQLVDLSIELWGKRVSKTKNINPTWCKELSEVIGLHEDTVVKMLRN